MKPTSPLVAQRDFNGPPDGERVLFCEHADLSSGITLRGLFHWHKFIPAETITRKEDGAEFEAEWFAVCDRCEQEYPEAADALMQDAVWFGGSIEITRVA